MMQRITDDRPKARELLAEARLSLTRYETQFGLAATNGASSEAANV